MILARLVGSIVGRVACQILRPLVERKNSPSLGCATELFQGKAYPAGRNSPNPDAQTLGIDLNAS